MKLHIFNPEHDLALAANQKQFTAPHAGRQLRTDLAFIPALWADDGDFVLVDDIDDAEDKLRHLGVKYLNKVEFITKHQLQKLMNDTFLVDNIQPWGWDLALKDELTRIGTPDIMMPTDEALAKIRAISSREWAANHLQDDVAYVTNVNELKTLVREKKNVVVKAPWSSSGRGVRFLSSDDFRQGQEYTSFERWVGNVIYRQGGITVETYYNKVKDFGMEFQMHDGKVEYCGLSLFDTIKNAYSGNVLATEEDKIEMMSSYVRPQQLETIRKHIMKMMEPVLKDVYQGPFGVDMMICSNQKDETGYCVNPCVELNLRRTMGHVALALSPKVSTRPQIMRVEYDGNRYHLRVMPGRPSEDAPNYPL